MFLFYFNYLVVLNTLQFPSSYLQRIPAPISYRPFKSIFKCFTTSGHRFFYPQLYGFQEPEDFHLLIDRIETIHKAAVKSITNQLNVWLFDPTLPYIRGGGAEISHIPTTREREARSVSCIHSPSRRNFYKKFTPGRAHLIFHDSSPRGVPHFAGRSLQRCHHDRAHLCIYRTR